MTPQHVVPNFGRKHEGSRACWCEPTEHPIGSGVWLHRYRASEQAPSVVVDGETETLQ